MSKAITSHSYTKRYVILILVFWSVVVGFSFIWNIIGEHSSIIQSDILTARAALDKDLKYRRWAANHGGVYVPVTEETQPNPYLSDIPNRDILTSDNQNLTLINPALMTRQVFEMESIEGSIRAHITSLNPIRPENAADPWEAEALRSFEHGDQEVVSVQEMDGQQYLRVMQPLVTESSCLKCHGDQGYQLGEIRGGISVSIPMDSSSRAMVSHYASIVVGHSLIWILGTAIILLGGKRIVGLDELRSRTENDLRLSEKKYRGLFIDALDMIHIVDKEGHFIDANPKAFETLGYSREDFTGISLAQIIKPEFREQTMATFSRLVEGDLMLGHRTALLTKSGDIVHVEVNAFPVFIDGEFHSATGILRDITKHLAIENELKQHRENLQLLVKQRTAELEIQIAERKATEEELRQSEAFATKLANLSVSGVYIFDPKIKRVVYLNPQYTNITGYTIEDYEKMTNKELGHLYHPDAWRPLDRHLEKVLNGKEGEIHEVEYRFRRSDGAWIWCVAFDTVFERDEDGKPVRIMGAMLDITKRKQAEEEIIKRSRDLEDSRKAALSLMEDAEEERIRAQSTALRLQESERHLREAKEEAEAANRAKSTFLANMTHEIRTPMNSILGFAQIMQNDSMLTSKQARHLRSITTSGEHLLSLINDILEMSKIEAGFLELNPTPFDLYAMLEDLDSIFRPRTVSQNLDLLVDIAENVPQFITADEQKLRQILINLLSNSIKFTEKGKIRVQVSRADATGPGKQTDGEVVLQFSVSDTGIGISPEEIGHLFKVFEQTSSGRQSHEGTGLGLAISQQFAQLMGKGITVESTPGKGSTFLFKIFTKSSPTPEKSLEEKLIKGLKPEQEECRILITDDKDSNRELLKQILETRGFSVREAENGKVALGIVKSWNPSLVLMDAKMPVMDGYEALSRIRNDPETRHTPVIMVTASAFEEDRRLAENAGVNGFLSKPIDLNNLLEMIGAVAGVEYEYLHIEPFVTGKGSKDSVDSVSESDLDSVDTSLVHNLRDAANAGDINRLETLILEISSTHPALATRLQEVVDSFNLELLVELFRDGDE